MLLYEWSLKGNRLAGFVEGSDRYPDGTYIETSEMMTAAFDGTIFLIRTGNSLYECEAEEFSGEEGELEAFIRKIAHENTKDNTRQIR